MNEFRLLGWGVLWAVVSVAAVGQTTPPSESRRKDAPSATAAGPTVRPRVRVETSLGDLTLELDGERAPASVLNFVQYAEDKFYDGTIFHRVIADFMIQGGAYTPDLTEKTQGLRPAVRNEWKNRVRNARGTVAVSRVGNQPDSGRASFFINVVDNGYLDKPLDGAAYAVFGKVVNGMDTVDKIRNTPVRADPKFDAGQQRPVVPVEPVIIKSVRMLDPLDRDKVLKLRDSFDSIVAEIERKARPPTQDEIAARVLKIETDAKQKMTKTASGLLYLDLISGKGGTPTPRDSVIVHYVGSYADGTVFDDSRTNPNLGGLPWEISMDRVIDGWIEGLSTMKTGGKRVLVVPPDLGYGERGRKGVLPNSTLFYEIELIGIK